MPVVAPRSESERTEARSHTSDDGWTHWELPAAWPELESVRVDSPPPEGPTELVEAFVQARAVGVPESRGAELHEVEFPRRWYVGRDTTERGVRMVVPGAIRGVRFAIDRGVLVPLSAMGPELDLIERFTAALDARDRVEAFEELCPLADAWPEVAQRGRGDLVERYAADLPWSAGPVADRCEELERRALSHFHRGDDEAARRDLAALEAFDDVVVPVARMSEELLSELREELAERAVSTAPAHGVEADLAALVDVTVEGELTPQALAEDPRVRALIARGERIVPRLIDALAPGRTTRVVYVEPFHSHPQRLLDRTDAVYAALASILDVDFHPPSVGDDYLTLQNEDVLEAVVRDARDYWETFHDVDPIERRWRVLSDDSRSAAEWAEAAMWLVEGEPTPRGFVRFRSIPVHTTFRMRGEPLRNRTRPSVTELMLLRLERTGADAPWACPLEIAAARWDPQGLVSRYDPLAQMCGRSLLPLIGDHMPGRLLELLQSPDGGGLMGIAAQNLEVWSRYLAEAVRDPQVSAALERLFLSGDGGLLDSGVMVAIELAHRGVEMARAALITRIRDDEVYGELWPGSEASVLGRVTVRLGEPATERRDVTRGEMVLYLAREVLELPYAFGADAATREAQRSAIEAALAPRP